MINHWKNPVRNLLAFGVASASLLSAVQAMAADSTVTYDIQPTCKVERLPSQLNQPTIADGRPRQSGQPFTLICDDPSGATLSLRTTNGGLQSIDDPTLLVDYRIRLLDFRSGIRYPALTLATDGTPFAEVTQVVATSADLVNPSSSNTFLELLAGFTFSGIYTDTLSINITGNP